MRKPEGHQVTSSPQTVEVKISSSLLTNSLHICISSFKNLDPETGSRTFPLQDSPSTKGSFNLFNYSCRNSASYSGSRLKERWTGPGALLEPACRGARSTPHTHSHSHTHPHPQPHPQPRLSPEFRKPSFFRLIGRRLLRLGLAPPPNPPFRLLKAGFPSQTCSSCT